MKRLLLVVLVLIGSAARAQNYNFLNGPNGGGADEIIAVGSGRILANKFAAGVWRSDDAGATWVKSVTGMSLNVTYVNDLYMDSSGKVYALQNNTLYLSNDNGANWSLLANTGFENAVRITQAPSGNLFIASSYGKVYRSTNGGTSWEERIQVNQTNYNGGVNDFEFTSGGKMLMATGTYGLYTTTAEGDVSATNITSPAIPGANVRSIVQNGSNIYLLTSGGPAKSTNAAVSFTAMTGGSLPSCCFYGDTMEKDPAGVLYVTNGSTLYKSTDGNTWSASTIVGPSPGATPTYTSLLFTSASTFYVSTYGVGIFKTTNTGSSWSPVNNGIYANDLYDIVIADNGRLLASKSNGYGIHTSSDDGASWNFLSTGGLAKPMKYFAKVATNTFLAFGQGIVKTTDNGANWTVVHDGVSTNFLYSFNMPLTLNGTTIYNIDTYDYATPGAPYTFGLWKSTNSGSTFSRTAITGMPSTQTTGFISDKAAVIDSNGNIYIITYTGTTNTLYKIPNGSTTATAITNSGLTKFIDIKAVGSKVYVAGESGKLAVTSDAGATWTAKTIDAVGYNRIQIIDDNTYYAYASSVFLSTDAGANWTNTGAVATGVSNIQDIAVSPSNYSYIVANYGGVYKSKTSIIPPAAPTALSVLTSTYDAVALEWTDNSTTETYFRVEGSKDDKQTYDSVGFGRRDDFSTRQQAFTYAYGLEPGKKYFFRIKAVGPGGFSTASNEIEVTLPAKCSTPSTIPSNRSWTATSLNTSGTNVPAQNNQPITKYSATDGDLWIPNLSLGVGGAAPALPSPPFEPLGAEIIDNCGNLFFYDEGGGSEWIPNGQATWDPVAKKITIPIKSNPYYSLRTETIVYTLNATDPAPAKPTNLVGGVYTLGKTLIGWQSPDFVTKFEIERSANNNSGYAKIGEVNATTLNYKDLDPNLVVGTKYYYRVRATNAAGASPYSDEIFIYPASQYNFDPIVNLPAKMFFTTSSGGAWGDVDGDGIEDLVTGTATDTLNRTLAPIIFKGDGKGQFSKFNITELQGENTGDYRMTSVIDVNNDGRNDLYFSRMSNPDILLIRNANGSWSKSFVQKPANSGIPTSAWVDIDNDGDLDLICAFAIASASDVKIFKNDGNGNLSEFTNSEIVTSTTGFTQDLEFADFDNDGLVDVLKLNRNTLSTARSVLYKNAGGGNFKAVLGSVFETVRAANRTASWGDYDNDGDLDVFTSATSLTAGNSNRLFKNNGDGTFSEVIGSAMTEQIVTYGSAWADIDNDTDLDLMITTSSSNRIYFNNGDGTFTKSTKDELFSNPNMGKLYGLSMADVDDDGFLDFYIGGFSGQEIPNFIFRNQNAPSSNRNWVKIKLQGKNSNRSAVGVRLKMVVGGKTLTRYVQSRSAYSTQSSLIQHFGLGSANNITSLTLYWPSGLVQELGSISSINTTLTVFEGDELDIARPTITYASNQLDLLQKGFGPKNDVNISVSDDRAVTGVTFFHRKSSETAFTPESLGISPTTFSVVSDMTDDMGMEYYFEASDAVGKSRAPVIGYYQSRIQYTGNAQPVIKVPGEGTKNSWKIISIPYEISTTQTSQIFSSLGTPAKNSWRLLHYSLNGETQTWLEYPTSVTTIERGKGYFINGTTATDVTLADPKSPTYSRTNLFKMNLVKGWNQIGNPYTVTIDWDKVRAFNGNNANIKELYLFNAGSYSKNSELLKETGGFVFAVEDVSDVSISFPNQVPSNGSRIKTIDFGPIDSESWMLDISASNSEMRSPVGGIGMTPESSNSYDELDQFSPPRFIDYLEFNFKHPEFFYPDFGRDVVKTSGEYEWQFDLETNLKGLTTLSWDKPSVANSDVQLYLYDVTRQKPIDMTAETSYTLDPSQGSTFKVYYGKDVLSKIKPNRTQLSVAYPNPLNSSTTIAFSIPEKAGKVSARLEVFDLTGRKVSTLANGQFDAGFYSAEWHPIEGTPDGMYIYRLTTSDEVLGGKMILKK